MEEQQEPPPPEVLERKDIDAFRYAFRVAYEHEHGFFNFIPFFQESLFDSEDDSLENKQIRTLMNATDDDDAFPDILDKAIISAFEEKTYEFDDNGRRRCYYSFDYCDTCAEKVLPKEFRDICEHKGVDMSPCHFCDICIRSFDLFVSRYCYCHPKLPNEFCLALRKHLLEYYHSKVSKDLKSFIDEHPTLIGEDQFYCTFLMRFYNKCKDLPNVDLTNLVEQSESIKDIYREKVKEYADQVYLESWTVCVECFEKYPKDLQELIQTNFKHSDQFTPDNIRGYLCSRFVIWTPEEAMEDVMHYCDACENSLFRFYDIYEVEQRDALNDEDYRDESERAIFQPQINSDWWGKDADPKQKFYFGDYLISNEILIAISERL
jgi:hypothetical protein